MNPKSVVCPLCKARVGENCFDTACFTIVPTHRQRYEATLPTEKEKP